jgi:multiple sugar transport system substrate-binding protein
MENLSRRKFLQGLGLAAVGAAAAACQPKTVIVEKAVKETVEVEKIVKETVVVEKAVQPEVLRIAFWTSDAHTHPRGEKILELTGRFNEEHAGRLNVDYVYTPTTAGTQMVEKLLTNIAAGTPPECSWFDRFIVASWAAEGSLTDLSEYAADAGIVEEDYFPFAWKEIHWKGKMYALPATADCRGIYYNPEHLKTAGFGAQADSFPTSLTEFDAMVEELTIKEGPRFKQVGFIPWAYQGHIFSYGWTFGGRFYDPATFEITVNDPRIVEACNWMVSYADKYDIENLDGFSESFGAEAMQGFTAGLLSIDYNGSWMVDRHPRYNPDLEFKTAPMPYPEGGRTATWAGGWSVVLPKGSPQPDAGWEFISWLVGPEQQHEYCTYAGYIPTQVKYAAEPVYREDSRFAMFMDLLPIADSRPPLPVGQLIWTGLSEIRDLMIHGMGTPQELLDDLNDRANEAMAKYR